MTGYCPACGNQDCLCADFMRGEAVAEPSREQEQAMEAKRCVPKPRQGPWGSEPQPRISEANTEYLLKVIKKLKEHVEKLKEELREGGEQTARLIEERDALTITTKGNLYRLRCRRCDVDYCETGESWKSVYKLLRTHTKAGCPKPRLEVYKLVRRKVVQ